MKRLTFERGRNGRGVRLMVTARRHVEYPVSLSYMDAAEVLFDLKDFLQSSDTGRRCLDEVHKRRQEAARAWPET